MNFLHICPITRGGLTAIISTELPLIKLGRFTPKDHAQYSEDSVQNLRSGHRSGQLGRMNTCMRMGSLTSWIATQRGRHWQGRRLGRAEERRDLQGEVWGLAENNRRGCSAYRRPDDRSRSRGSRKWYFWLGQCSDNYAWLMDEYYSLQGQDSSSRCLTFPFPSMQEPRQQLPLISYWVNNTCRA